MEAKIIFTKKIQVEYSGVNSVNTVNSVNSGVTYSIPPNRKKWPIKNMADEKRWTTEKDAWQLNPVPKIRFKIHKTK